MKEIKHSSGHGSLIYFTCDVGSERFFCWLNNYSDQAKENIKQLKKMGLEEVIVLSDLFVDDEAKNQGIGKGLLTDFLFNNQCKNVVLVADAFGSNHVNLESWYSRYGFKTVVGLIAGPLMVKS